MIAKILIDLAKSCFLYIMEQRGNGAKTMEKDYQQLMADLRAGKIDSFVITPEEFMAFQIQYQANQFRQEIVGTAKRGGEIEYHLEKKQ